MAITLASLAKNEAKPKRILIYGSEGIGKTGFAVCESFDVKTMAFGPVKSDVVVIRTEDGLGDLPVTAFPLAATYQDVLDSLVALAQEDHEFKTLVIDSLDWLEPLIWKHVCELNKWNTIEAPGYGRGYAVTDGCWRTFFDCVNWLRDKKGMTPIFICHQQVIQVNDPELPEYQAHDIKLHKRAAAIAKEYVDIIGHARHKVFVTNENMKDANSKKKLSTTGRILVLSGKPGTIAKNRYSLPEEMPLSWDKFRAALQAV